MRIGLVVTGGFDESGRERVIPSLLALVERLAGSHEVAVYVLRYHDRPRTYPLLGATIHDLGSPRGLRRQYSALLSALRRDGSFDVVHGYWALPAGLAAAAAGRRLGVPSIVTFDSGELIAIPDIQYGLQLRWRQRLAVSATMKLASRITVCSQAMESLARARGISPDVIPLGVDVGRFTPASGAGRSPRLLHVASLNAVKDQGTLIHALARVIDRFPDVHLDVAGEDTLGGAVQALAWQAGIDRHITFHGVLPTDSVIALYQRAHLLVLSSRHEAAGVVVLEAAACGLATVGSRVGYLADWAPDRAVAVAPADPVALADAIAELLADAPRRERLAAAARAWTLDHDADWTAREFVRVYGEISKVHREDQTTY
jgi:glycosyltransferase involved in cell wall biosynthesis